MDGRELDVSAIIRTTPSVGQMQEQALQAVDTSRQSYARRGSSWLTSSA
jgi:hypothetical protein